MVRKRQCVTQQTSRSKVKRFFASRMTGHSSTAAIPTVAYRVSVNGTPSKYDRRSRVTQISLFQTVITRRLLPANPDPQLMNMAT
jgi:hypothetical protein